VYIFAHAKRKNGNSIAQYLLAASLVTGSLVGCKTTADRPAGVVANPTPSLNRMKDTVDAKVTQFGPAASSDQLRELKDEVRKSAAEDFNRVLATCSAELYKREVKADGGRRASFWIAVTGTLAGAVVAPALVAKEAAGSTVSAWSGLSGATNTLQHALKDTGLDAASVILAREELRSETIKAADQYHEAVRQYAGNAGEYEKIQAAIARMASICALPPIPGAKLIEIQIRDSGGNNEPESNS